MLLVRCLCGFVGRDTPDLVIVVRIHEAEPTVRRRNGVVLPEVQSFDLFRRIAQEAINVLDLAPLSGPSDEPGLVPDYDPPPPSLDPLLGLPGIGVGP